ncbi:NUDIX hydrolase [Endomicrobiia bacterium]|nr:NUDIX hydrolase [Endomicrobiia bacterium]GHT14693.1 NUDIX hydrolase [Endomicrobiia bacterium]GHT19854.1 NUDIX hydrolase [Endomicrobiia bacterium]GHT26390.1 NUDIX hydrolase [Endomicrobiia bacterium]GHT30239.1 NUDIX hydrolase [Endomicrobiia bacterium]
MLKEFSCGAVLYKMKNDNPLFLLVNSKRSRMWGFPKGHIENCESEIETARREIFEETGIKNISFIKNFRQEDVYIIDDTASRTDERQVEKHSIYFLASALEDASDFDKNEILELKWANINQARDMLSFANQKKIVNSAAYNLIIGGQHEQSAFKR